MPIPQRGTVAGALVATLAILAALVGVPPTASARTTLDPYAGAAEVGDCKDYSRGAGTQFSESSAPVDCAAPHTAKVIAVALLPDHLDWDSGLADLGRFALRQCFPAWEAILGRSDKVRWMSAYGFFWFYPTIAEKQAGARWIRCDVILTGGATKLMPLPADSAPMLPPAPLPNSAAACLSGDELDRTVCSRSHRYRATGGKTLDQATYPRPKARTRIAKEKCPALTISRRWYAVWPSRFAWRLGQHTLVCYSKTSS